MHVPAGEGGANDLSAAKAAAEAVQGQEGGARGADSRRVGELSVF